MNVNKDGIVLLHPPQERGFRGHPSDLRQLQLPCPAGWSRETLCLPWCVVGKTQQRMGPVPGRKIKKKESPLGYALEISPYSMLRTTENQIQYTGVHIFMEVKTLKLPEVPTLKFCEKLLNLSKNCCSNLIMDT